MPPQVKTFLKRGGIMSMDKLGDSRSFGIGRKGRYALYVTAIGASPDYVNTNLVGFVIRGRRSLKPLIDDLMTSNMAKSIGQALMDAANLVERSTNNGS
jgi:hypothetical protein